MRILVLTPTFLPAVGGAEFVILQVYRRLASKHSVLVLTPELSQTLINNTSSNEYDHLINFDVEHYSDKFTFMTIRGHKVTWGLIPPFSLSAIFAIKQQIKKFKPDVINVHYVMPTGLSGLYAQIIKKIPVVITYNGRDVPGPGVPRLWKFWHRFVGGNSADMTFVSGYCREAIYGSKLNAGHVIYNGVDQPVAVSVSQKRELKDRLNLKDNEHVLFALQRLDPLKRVDVLIQCLPKILQHHPCTRLIVGGKGSDLARLKNLAIDLNVADRVHFAGFISQDELPVYFRLADLFVFHSTYETFGMVLAEAMNYGKAIVSVENTAIKEVVDKGENGILVPTLDVKAFSSAVIDLLDNAAKRHRFGLHGIQKVQRLFRWDHIARQYDEIFRKAATK